MDLPRTLHAASICFSFRWW